MAFQTSCAAAGGFSCLPDVVADGEGRELVQHGSALFPIACYEENLKSYSVAWHWHEEFEYILAVKGPLAVDVSKARLVLQTGQGGFVNSGVFHAVEQALGRVDVLVSNAGIAQQKLFTDITPEEWQRMLDVNLTGAFNLCQLALPGMIRRKAGRILTVSSMWGQTGGSCEVHYSAAKAGLIGLTKALAKEEGPSGITVNCVAPGVIDTDMMASFTAEDKAALAEETPVGRLGTAEEVAKLLLYLAGEDAGYITGQVFGVNGGLVI